MIINTKKFLSLAEAIYKKTQYFLTCRCLDPVHILLGYT